MKNLIERIDDLIYEILNAYYLNRKKTQSRLEDFSDPLILHLIKILKWEDDINYKKHINDINNKWLLPMQRRKINKKRISSKDYENYLFRESFPDNFKEFDIIVNSAEFDEYRQNLKEVRSNKEVYDKINSMIKPICDDLSNYNFQTIENYL